MKDNLKLVIQAAKALEAGAIEEGAFKKVLFDYICDDESIIPNMLAILKSERAAKEELLSDINLELSRVTATMEIEKEWDDSTPKKRKENEKQNQWVYNQAILFYYKWKDRIGHCFMNPEILNEKYRIVPEEDKERKTGLNAR